MATGRIPATGQIVNTNNHDEPKYLYVNKIGDDGWLRTQFGDHPINYIYLCKYTRLQALPSNNRRPTENRRSYFKVMDGPQYGKIVSLNEINAGIYIGSYAPTSSPTNVVVTYGKYVKDWVSEARGGETINQQMATLNVGNITAQVTMNSNWNSEYYPLPQGEYKILIPDTPHDAGMTRFYRNSEPSLKYDQVWFPVQYTDNSRYVHIGNVSDGCVTVIDLAQWSAIHEALISHRVNDRLSVGKLIVKGKPEREK